MSDTRDHSSSEPKPDGRSSDPGHGVADRKGSKSDEYASGQDSAGSQEGNDPSLTAGKTFVREVPGGSGNA
ncbi:MAG TPA: hypothetical protein VLK29_00835 [Luteimonas sp.]|nr:hypothetical protein [Luteimonas sp.]